ncbi:MAG TPA: response regulator [Firmicutes bacterium]|nr:response regulator [Bacillota bacterium]
MKKVLIVDDTKFMRNILKNILVKKDIEIIGEAVNGKEAVEKYKEMKPDLVTMDIIMPEMNGIEAVKAIMGENPDAKILMCSAMGQQAMVIEAIQAGAKDFVIKPFQPARVLEAVDRTLQEG